MDKTNRLILLQHGGGYGIAKMHLGEMVESYLGNKFLTWGWREKKGKKHQFYSMRISQLKNKILKNTSKSKIVFFISSYTKFFQKIGFYPTTNYQTVLQFRYIANIVNRLKKDLKNKLILRYSKYGFDRGGLEFPKNLFDKNIAYDELMKPYYKSINKNTLTIHDNINNSTAWIETLALNIPTIIFADANTNDVRTSFVKTFKLLKKNNIVFTDTLSLSNFVNDNYENLNEWWSSKKIQNARLITIKKYARIHKKPVECLKKRIIKEIKKIN
jgi:putative transferase (TIGR04331 family)